MSRWTSPRRLRQRPNYYDRCNQRSELHLHDKHRHCRNVAPWLRERICRRHALAFWLHSTLCLYWSLARVFLHESVHDARKRDQPTVLHQVRSETLVLALRNFTVYHALDRLHLQHCRLLHQRQKLRGLHALLCLRAVDRTLNLSGRMLYFITCSYSWCPQKSSQITKRLVVYPRK